LVTEVTEHGLRLSLSLFLSFFFNSQKGIPELVLKDQKDIALEITVTNSPSDPRNPRKDGDDAHEAKLIATFPDTLTYSAYRELRAFPVSVFEKAAGRERPVSHST
jgi:hypothetical protein